MLTGGSRLSAGCTRMMHAQARTAKPSNQRSPLLSRLRRSLLLAVLVAVAAAVLGLAACGGDGGGGDEDASTVINETFSGKKEVNSGKLDMSVTAKLEGTGAAAAARRAGLARSSRGRSRAAATTRFPRWTST